MPQAAEVVIGRNPRIRKYKKKKPTTLKGKVELLDKRISSIAGKNKKTTEWKEFIYNSASTADSSGSVYEIFNPAQGDGQSERLGDECFLSSINIRGHCTANTTKQIFRCLVVVDKSNDMSSIGDVLDATYVGTSNVSNAFREIDKINKYKVLYDQTFAITTTAGETVMLMKAKIPVSRKVVFDTGTTTVMTNSIKLLVLSPTIASPPSFAIMTKCNFCN